MSWRVGSGNETTAESRNKTTAKSSRELMSSEHRRRNHGG